MAAAPPDPIETALEWIGFTDPAQRASLLGDFGTFEDIADLKHDDIDTLASSYSKRTVAEGRIHFGLARIRRLKALIHWVQDFGRVSEEPTLDDLDQASFRAELKTAASRAEIRSKSKDTSESLSSEASPGMLESEKDWVKWSTGLTNMLGIMLGVTGVPLVYVIRSNDDPEPEGHNTFVQKCIACAPLHGPTYEADARTVHLLIESLTTGTPSEQWLKDHKNEQDGRVDFQALTDHYQGEGNTSRRISEAERLEDTLHYRSERAMPFESFVNKMQEMFNIFEENDEPKTEAQKLRFLWEKTQHKELQTIVATLKAQNEFGEGITFTSAVNHIAAAVANLPETIAIRRSISAVDSGGGGREGGIYNADGSINTGYHKNWHQLSKEDKQKVIDERIRLGISRSPKNPKQKVASVKSLKKKNRKLASQLKEANRKISALSTNTESDAGQGAQGAGGMTGGGNNAGDAFGGRSERRNART